MSTTTKLVFWASFVIFLIVAGPLLTIWAANTLFPALAIAYSFDTWLAVIILGAFIRGETVKVSKK